MNRSSIDKKFHLTIWSFSTLVLTLVAAVVIAIAVTRSPQVTLKSVNCKASDVSLKGGPILGAGGTDGDEFQLQFSGSGYCSFSGYPLWSFFNPGGGQLTNGSSEIPAGTLFGQGGFATQLVKLSRTSPISTGFEYFYSSGTPAEGLNPPSCMASYGDLELPLADNSGEITITNIPLKGLKLNFCLIGKNISMTPIEGSSWPGQTEEARPVAPREIQVRKP